MSKGMTPESNANVRLWKALGPHTERATMPADFFKWLGIKQPPEKGDYLYDFRKHAEKHIELDPTKKINDLIDEYYSRGDAPWKASQHPAVAGWLLANEKPLATAIQATKRPHYFSPLVSKGT